jgi:hypothetical protein
MVMTVPSMPADLQMVQPDPSLPKELLAFWGKWELASGMYEVFVIVEKIDEQKASLYVWRGGSWPQEGYKGTTMGWGRVEAKVIKERGKYKLWYQAYFGKVENTLKGKYLVSSSPLGSSKFRRVP